MNETTRYQIILEMIKNAGSDGLNPEHVHDSLKLIYSHKEISATLRLLLERGEINLGQKLRLVYYKEGKQKQ